MMARNYEDETLPQNVPGNLSSFLNEDDDEQPLIGVGVGAGEFPKLSPEGSPTGSSPTIPTYATGAQGQEGEMASLIEPENLKGGPIPYQGPGFNPFDTDRELPQDSTMGPPAVEPALERDRAEEILPGTVQESLASRKADTTQAIEAQTQEIELEEARPTKDRISEIDEQLKEARTKGFSTNEVEELKRERKELYLKGQVEGGRLEEYTTRRGAKRYRPVAEPEGPEITEEPSPEESAVPQTPEEEYRRRTEGRKAKEKEFWEGQREKERTRPERESEQVEQNREERLKRGRDYQQDVQDRIKARREGFETRKDMREEGRQRRSELREWQRTAREAQRQGVAPPPMPGKQAPQAGAGTWQQPGFDAEGGYTTQFVDPETGQSSSIGLTEDPGAPGTFIPKPGTSLKTLGQNAFNPDMQSSMDHLLKVGRKSGIKSSVYDRFEKVHGAAKNINRGAFAPGRGGDNQFAKAKASIQSEWAGLAGQLVEMSPRLFRERTALSKKEEDARKEKTEDNVDRTYRKFIELVRENQSSDYRRSEKALLRQAQQEIHREDMIREALGANFRGDLTDEGAAQFATTAFPDTRRRQNQQLSAPAQAGIEAPYGVTTTADPDLLWNLSDSIRNEYQKLPYTVSSDEQTGQLIIASSESGSFPGAIVEGYDLPVAISHNQSDERRLIQAGIPFIRTKDPFTVIDNHAQEQIKSTAQIEAFPQEKTLERVHKELRATTKDAFEKGRAYDIETAEHEEARAQRGGTARSGDSLAASETNLAEIARAVIEGTTGAKSSTPRSPLEPSDTAPLGTFLSPLEDIGDAPEPPDQELMSIYQRVKDDRNESLQKDFEIQFDNLTQEYNDGHLLPSHFEQKRNELLESHQKAQATPLEEADFTSAVTQKMVAEEMSLEREKWANEQKNNAVIERQSENDFSDQYRSTYNRRTVNGQISYTIADYNRNGRFTPRPLPVVNQGTRGAEMPVVRSIEDVASIGFDAPVLIRTEDGEMQQVTFQRALFKPAIDRAISAGHRMESGGRAFVGETEKTKVERNPPEEAIVDLGRLVDKHYPGRLSSAEGKEIAKQLMRRFGYTTQQEQLGY